MTDSSKKSSQILSYLYLGGKNDAKNEKWLKSMGIRYILNCTPPRTLDPVSGTPNYFQKDKYFIYKRIPVFDNQGEDILSHMDSAIRFIEEGRHYGSILVHCHRGISRSTSFVIAYLMKKNEFTRDEAIDYVRGCRPIIQPNDNFLSQLSTYETQLKTVDIVSYDDVMSYERKRSANVVESTVGPSLPTSSCNIVSNTVIISDEAVISNDGAEQCDAKSSTASILGKRTVEYVEVADATI